MDIGRHKTRKVENENHVGIFLSHTRQCEGHGRSYVIDQVPERVVLRFVEVEVVEEQVCHFIAGTSQVNDAGIVGRGFEKGEEMKYEEHAAVVGQCREEVNPLACFCVKSVVCQKFRNKGGHGRTFASVIGDVSCREEHGIYARLLGLNFLAYSLHLDHK